MSRATLVQLPLDFAIQDEFSFRTFIAAQANRQLVETLRRLDGEGERFHYLWGGRGAGKTHLLQSVRREHEDAAYLPLRRLAGRAAELPAGLEGLPLVCLDDVDAVLGDARWEERLFQLYNELRERGGRLLVSAAAPPRGLRGALPDLASRLAWGVTWQVEELDDAGKAEALRARAHARGFELGDDILRYILLRSARGMDSLFDVLDRLDHLSLTEKRKVTIPFIREIMGW